MRGMVVSSYLHRFPEYARRAVGWIADGSLRGEETVFDGLERAPEVFLGVLRGVNTGKVLVRLDAR